ncbi:hypothetical protein [Roseateles oligotrophus]|uniref:Uncharacterized protein n=1 Tax=Roseateles oligotrophus TaxID=1769250 RepID=A0ABT2YGZ7_9BURK|nr:hypothetical protein [Roseateles oligotrophus]MCV2369271.1 hypothetical protein [Roseateles oligotrophus]
MKTRIARRGWLASGLAAFAGLAALLMRAQASGAGATAEASVTVNEAGRVLEMIRPLASASSTESGSVLIRIAPSSPPIVVAATATPSQAVQTSLASTSPASTGQANGQSNPSSSEAAATLTAQASDGTLRGDTAVAISASAVPIAPAGSRAAGETGAGGAGSATERLSIMIAFN